MDIPTLLSIAGPIIIATITVIGTVWVARSRARVDVGAAITSGFDSLTNQLQEERATLMEILRQKNADAEACEITMRRMRRHVEVCEGRLEKAGLEVPPRVGWE